MKTRTEHNGAKRGKGFWGRKQEAKAVCNIRRRQESKQIIKDYLEEDNYEYNN